MSSRASARFLAASPYPGSVATLSEGNPQTPYGGGIIAPPFIATPWYMLWMNDERSRARFTAFLILALSNGGRLALMRMLSVRLVPCSWIWMAGTAALI